ncbi:MAG TPA: glutaredoxin family protein [Anaerolineales bacterium]|nr:glutaredoxin family protein [Anaerolineales bacterium]
MFCETEKAWLSQHGIAFTERNVATDPSALQELERLEVFSTPATLVDDKLVVGFNRKRLEELLGLAPG